MKKFLLIPFIDVNNMFCECTIFFTAVLQTLQLNPANYVTNVAILLTIVMQKFKI